MTDLDPALLPLSDLRALRSRVQADDDAVSYVRRVAQARLDLIEAEMHRRAARQRFDESHHDDEVDVDARPELADDLPAILGGQLTGGRARPPRPTVDASDHPLALELEALCARGGVADVEALDDAELTELETELREFEQKRSRERQALFVRIDALSAELVRRYRDDDSAVDSLLADE